MSTRAHPSRRGAPARRGRRAVAAVASLLRGLLAAVMVTALVGGLPWALTRFVGWPLPDHVPSWAEIEGVLLGPMSAGFLLDVLACAAWLVWALFTLDVARVAVVIARDTRLPDLSAAGPVHRVAAVLVGAILISLLGQRTGTGAASTPTAAPVPAVAATTLPGQQTPAALGTEGVRLAAYTSARHTLTAASPSTAARSAVVLPYNPATGKHDSLWRMAERELGDGNRWPEIYELNKGKPQPGGGRLTCPSLVFPGEELLLPSPLAAAPVEQPTPPAADQTPEPVTSPSPLPPTTPTMPSTPARQAPQDILAAPTTAPAPAPHDLATPPASAGEAGVRWGEEVFVGLGLAAAVSAALLVARRRHRRRYRPGSGDRTDLPVAPVVYGLRLAHLRADHDDPFTDNPPLRPPHIATFPVIPGTGGGRAASTAVPVGVRDGRELALDLAAAHGLGLLGAGAPAAARALLVTALAGGEARVIVPATDLASVLGRYAARGPLPAALCVVADLDAALDELEAQTLVRLNGTNRRFPPLILIAHAPTRHTARLQAVLDIGVDLGVTGLLLGQWSPGITAYVRDDGVISTTNPGHGEPLRGVRVFRLGDDHTGDLLALLHHADRDTHLEHRAAAVPHPRPGPADEPDIPGAADDLGVAGPAGGEPSEKDSSGDTVLEILDTDISPASHEHPRPVGDAPSTCTVSAEDTVDTRDGQAAIPSPIRISVLGPPRLWWRPETREEVEVTSAFPPRIRELLVFLALHTDGVSREALVAAMWPISTPERATNALNTSLSRIRGAVSTATEGALSDVVIVGDGRYQLDLDLVEVDFHRFAGAVTARRLAATEQDRVRAYRAVVDSYAGPLADGASTEWIETAREAIRRDAIDAVAALARALVGHDPQQTMDLLEMARSFDPHNEALYRDIMRLQAHLGQLDAIGRTLGLLTTRLAEIDERPTAHTVELATRLRHRHDRADNPGTPWEPGRDHTLAS
ncbi:BTAD domain-containing putative transcriptional regulator [Actinokineospora diospyrosa]|uniref:Transcriptional activator domain-containing protein n=1 Tax=Actinokineospora diospyrosa TaxID=103728 RepID=A0ABT1IA54_9PSEU|nr:BTAD domain-containing putative transcriptional regulator [Actinokineospora diospyrosa]MCP2269236.1 transcriptional activator domain-containing protein [Actinokineospora diospyrosa]